MKARHNPKLSRGWRMILQPHNPLFKAVLGWWDGQDWDESRRQQFYTEDRARRELKELQK